MFDVGFLELFVIAVIALLVLGPERLPGAARQAGRWLGKAKQMVHYWSSEINRQIENEALAKELKDKASLGQLEQDMQSFNTALSQSLTVQPPQDGETANVQKTPVESVTKPPLTASA